VADLRARVAQIALAAIGLHACFQTDDVHVGSSRALDSACEHDACKVSGSARVIQGPTNDSHAIHLGPGPGRIDIPLAQIRPRQGDSIWSYEALMAGHGAVSSNACATSCAGNNPRFVSSDYAWTTIAADSEGAPPTVLTIESSEGTEVDIADVRVVSSAPPGNCGVSRVGPR
jgi:hypothetical protein